MNAHKFVAEKGIDEAKRVLSGAPEGADLFHTNTYIKNAHSEGYTDYFARWSDGFKDWVNASADREFIDESIDLSELKQVVESVEIVDRLGELNSVKKKLYGKHIGYTHFNVGANGRCAFLDYYVDFIPDSAYHIGLINKHIADYELVESYKEVGNG